LVHCWILAICQQKCSIHSVPNILFAGDEIKTQLDAIQKEEVEFDQQYIQWKQQYDDWKKQNESKHYLF
jgi:hypothetical protein